MNAALIEVGAAKGAASSRMSSTRSSPRTAQLVVDAAGTIADVYRGDGRLFSMGNGGSSCDAAHVAVEFLHPITAGRPALPAINLAADRDDDHRGRQRCRLRARLRPPDHRAGPTGDGLIGISTSGNSQPVTAFAKAKEMGL